jgi:hypothetical protein
MAMAFQRHVPAATDEDGLQIFSVVPETILRSFIELGAVIRQTELE